MSVGALSQITLFAVALLVVAPIAVLHTAAPSLAAAVQAAWATADGALLRRRELPFVAFVMVGASMEPHGASALHVALLAIATIGVTRDGVHGGPELRLWSLCIAVVLLLLGVHGPVRRARPWSLLDAAFLLLAALGVDSAGGDALSNYRLDTPVALQLVGVLLAFLTAVFGTDRRAAAAALAVLKLSVLPRDAVVAAVVHGTVDVQLAALVGTVLCLVVWSWQTTAPAVVGSEVVSLNQLTDAVQSLDCTKNFDAHVRISTSS